MGEKSKSKPSGRATIYLSNEMKGLLDSVAARRGMTRSEAAIEAITEWVRRHEEEDFERSYGLGREIREQADRLHARLSKLDSEIDKTKLAVEIVYENVREVGTSANRTAYEELRRRAMAGPSRNRGSRSAQAKDEENSEEE